MMRAKVTLFATLAVACWAVVCLPALQDPSAVVVEVTEAQSATGVITYSYRVTHKLQGQSLMVLDIGVAPDPKADWTLRAVPLGWTLKSGHPVGSVISPAGWKAEFTPQEDAGGSLRWSRGDNGVGILAMNRSPWFRVTTDKPDPNYSAPDGYFKVTFGPPKFREVSGRLTKASTPK